MRGCLIVTLLLFMVPFGFCAAVTHDNSVLLVPLVIIAPFVLLGIVSSRSGGRAGQVANKFVETIPDESPHRAIDQHVTSNQESGNHSKP